MARNGSGTYNRAVAPYVAGTTITAATVNSEMDDIATALTQSLSRDGQSPPTANIPMGNFRITGLANAVASTDAAPLGQVVAKAGDTMTGALGFAVGTAALPGVFVSGDTNTGFFQAAAAPDTLSISVGGTEVARYGTGGFMRLAAGTAAAPAYSFSGDPDTGASNPGANQYAIATGGAVRFLVDASSFVGVNTLTPARQLEVASANNHMRFSVPGDATAYYDAGRDNVDGLFFFNGAQPTFVGYKWQINGTERFRIPATGPVTVDGRALQIQRGTEQATTSGTAIDFTGIPAGVRRITVMFDGVSFNGSDSASIQLGDSGGIETTGYVGNVSIVAGSSAGLITSLTSAAGIIYPSTAAADNCSGVIQIVNQSGNKWLIAGQTTRSGLAQIHQTVSTKTLSDVLDRIRFKVDGANSFDAGSINILWEF